MDGFAYLALANRLAGGPSEAEYRTSVSRGYYGAFHLACGLVNRCGIQLPRTADAHNKLQWCLSQAGSPDLLLAASLLASLRSARNAADYDLGAAEFRKSAYVAQQARIAEQVAGLLAATESSGEFGKIRVAIRSYAKETLGLKMSEP